MGLVPRILGLGMYCLGCKALCRGIWEIQLEQRIGLPLGFRGIYSVNNVRGAGA